MSRKFASRVITSRSYSFNHIWTTDNVVRSRYKEIDAPISTIPEYVFENVVKWADKTAVVCGVTNQSYTYTKLYNFSRNFAANLRRKLKIKDKDVVCVMMHNCPEYVVAALGIMQSGAEMTTVNPIYTAHELQKQLALSNPKVIIGTAKTIPVIINAYQLAKKEIPIIAVKHNGEEKTISFEELIEDGADHSVLKEVRAENGDVALLPYSSGTTGLPKGVELTHRNVVVNCAQQNVIGVKQFEDTTSLHQDSVMAVLPFYHIYGLSIIMCHKLSIGAKLVTLPKFQPNSFLQALKEHKITTMYAAPPLVLFLSSHPEVTKQHTESIKRIMCGAAPLPKQDIMKTLERLRPSADFLQVYGLTETSPLVTAMNPGSINYTSAGYAIPNTELKIVGSEMNSLGPNQIGELWIRGPQVMKGYRNNPEATKACITEDGWFKSGDLATLDVDGSLKIADRLKELIKVKGYQVPPAELESVLKDHPAVLDAGVIGVPDDKNGEAPKAFVVLNANQKVAEEELMKFVKERVAEYKRIKDVVFLDSLPKNPSGKLLRRVLKEKYC